MKKIIYILAVAIGILGGILSGYNYVNDKFEKYDIKFNIIEKSLTEIEKKIVDPNQEFQNIYDRLSNIENAVDLPRWVRFALQNIKTKNLYYINFEIVNQREHLINRTIKTIPTNGDILKATQDNLSIRPESSTKFGEIGSIKKGGAVQVIDKRIVKNGNSNEIWVRIKSAD